ncbi:MAG TPA: amidohydrolase [Xanthomonadales bacterium]|nr:amidohydrolase [Xanthomonadales bacterium]
MNSSIELRRWLHAHPELSEREQQTAARIAERLNETAPARLLEGLGSMQSGLCAVYHGKEPGPAVLIRCELDALPIAESNRFEHRSKTPGVSHKCGHDGHMATLVRLAELLSAAPPPRGRVLLLFQPAEETGTGACAVLDDPRFQELGAPDFVYAFHNVPRFELGTVLIRRGVFAQASVGFAVRFEGSTSHSSYPEHGRSPARAVTKLVEAVSDVKSLLQGEPAAPVLGTVTFAQLGEAGEGSNFGVAPGTGLVMGVLRSQYTPDLDELRLGLEAQVKALAEASDLHHSLSWHEPFAATHSEDGCVERVAAAAFDLGLKVEEVAEPFRWSEDFGHFTDRYTGAFFGLGSGSAQPQLHDDAYDYPEELIETGARLYRAIIDQHLGDANN